MVGRLVGQLLAFPEVAQIILTLNVPESVALPDDARVTVIGNAEPKGFGANHNAAFAVCTQTFFCPLNPDIEFDRNPFPILCAALEDNRVALVAPLVRSPDGKIEDSMRRFPTPSALLIKALGGKDGRYVVRHDQANFSPEWVAGMFMLFRSCDFQDLGGFDERFFLYYEDVDLCARVWEKGLKILACPQGCVIHDAQRESRRRLRHLRWHLASVARFFWKHWGRLPRVPGAPP
ncbi:MAG: glycosyltransferase family 2 protein [Candidatus Accumulibacter sp.]|uniref:Glycosyltransferase family 2 protein n=1 Tax=Candidatus Accumulibacter proximus TaxID=2954385 RepID=A0A935UGR6_9PROT|nr:glycosyltransferase family 2 protein [Candidatus Accumulibacter proximus]